MQKKKTEGRLNRRESRERKEKIVSYTESEREREKKD